MESPLSNMPSQFPVEEPQEKSNNWLLRVAKWALVALLLLVMTSFIIGYIFEDEIKAKLVEEINDQLKTELTVGSFDLSLLSSFPYMSANFSDVALEGVFSSEAPFVEATTISFRFSLLELLKSEVTVKSVLLKDGVVSIYINSNGLPNYKVFKARTESQSGADDFQLAIENAILENIEIIYTNNNTDILSRVHVDKAELSGDFSADHYALQSKGEGVSHYIEVSEKRFIVGNQLEFDFILDIDMNKNLYAFEKGDLLIDDNLFNITGDIIADPDGFIYDLKTKSKDGNLASVLTLLPTEYIESFRGVTSTGRFLFDFTYKGQKTAKKNPALNAKMILKEGQIKSPLFAAPLKEVSLSASFTNGKYKNLKSSSLNISNFKGYFNRELTEMELRISDMEDPFIDLELDGTIPVKSVYKFFKKEHITKANGEFEIKDLKVSGKQTDMASMSKISKVKVSGEIEFDDAGLSINGYPFLADRGSLMLRGNNIAVKELYLKGADSDALFSGDFKNLIPVLFADSTNSQNAQLIFDAQLTSEKMDLDQLVDAFTSEEMSEEETEEDMGWHSRISGFLDGSFEAYVESLHYNELEGQEFEGSLDFEDEVLTISGDVDAMDGSMSIEGELFLIKQPKLTGEIAAKNIDVYKFFKQSNNFGQEVIIADNLKGRMNTNMIIKAYFDERGTFLTDKLKVYAGLEIHNGELVDLEMLENFSTYLNSKDLQRIKFTRLENWFEIDNGKIHIPVMFLQSNAVNMMVNGTHTFDHDIDYNIKINAGQVLLKKFKKHDRLLRPEKDQRNGLLNFHFTIMGTVEDYVVKNNRKAVQKDFKASIIKKEYIRKKLEEAFGNFVLDDSSFAKTPKPKKPQVAKPKQVKNDPIPQEEVIEANLENVIPEFEYEEESEVEYIEFQGDDG